MTSFKLTQETKPIKSRKRKGFGANTIAIALIVGLGFNAVCAQDQSQNSHQDQSGDQNIQIFKPEFFEKFLINNAYEMVTRVPGFQFQSGQDARGFAGTAGNVLIDGQRPSSKSGLDNFLSQIAVVNVERIELITGGAPGIDMSGYRQVVNIVRKPTNKPTIKLSGLVRHHYDRATKGYISGSYSKNSGDVTTDLNGVVFSFMDNGANPLVRTIRPSVGAVEIINADGLAGGTGIESQFSHSRPIMGGKASFNFSYNPLVYELDASFNRGGLVDSERQDKVEVTNETGLQYERKITPKLSLDTNVLRRFARERFEDVYIDPANRTDYISRVVARENIVSGKLTYVSSDRLTLSTGSEIVFNGRESKVDYLIDSVSQGLTGSSVIVEEDRTETFGKLVFKPQSQWNLEGELKVETSTIGVKQTDRSDSFTYYKPRLQAIYSLDTKKRIAFKYYREVDQLDFGDFASSVELNNNLVTLGNTDLVPQKAWVTEITFERSFWESGNLSLGVSHRAIEDTSDIIAIFDGASPFSATGNLGDSERSQLMINLDTPLDRLWIKGGILKLEFYYRHTSVVDPITDRHRPISGIEPYRYEINFTQNLKKLNAKWGIEANTMDTGIVYGAKEKTTYHSEPWITIWGEYRSKSNLLYSVRLNNPFRLYQSYDRIIYNGLREKSPISRTILQKSSIDPMLIMRITKEWS
jgi:hypothetical protein